MTKLCECGCGQPAPIAKQTHLKHGHIKGQPVRFVKGHGSRVCHHINLPGVTWDDLEDLYVAQKHSATEIAAMKHCSSSTVLEHLRKQEFPRRDYSERHLARFEKHPPDHQPILRCDGYILIYKPEHPQADNKGYVREHRLVVEARIGRYLSRGEPVHHINGIRDDNRDVNLQLLSPSDHSTREMFCKSCPLKNELRLLRLQVKHLTETIQLSMESE